MVDESALGPLVVQLAAAHERDVGPATAAQPAAVLLEPAPEPHTFYHASKRLVDVTLGTTLLVVSAPVVVAAATVVALVYRTNPFYLQRRVGYLGREFRMIKLKSMRDGADQEIPTDLNETGGPTFKARRDPRTTSVGRFLRKASIDELPQFINVLLGHMSLVGPRPPLAREVTHYRRTHLERLRVKPGLTCIWQVSGRSDIGFRRWMAADRAYVRRRNIWFDLYLLVLTPWAVLTMRGAR